MLGLINIFKLPSTFLKPALLIKLSNIDNVSSEKISGVLGIKPRAAGWEASMLPLCYAAPPLHYKNEKNRRALGYDGINSFNKRKIIVYSSGWSCLVRWWFSNTCRFFGCELCRKQTDCLSRWQTFQTPKKKFFERFPIQEQTTLWLIRLESPRSFEDWFCNLWKFHSQPPFLPILLRVTVLDYCNYWIKEQV